MNIEFLVVTYIIGKAVDYIIQFQHHAELKSNNMSVLLEHSLIYSLCTTSIVSTVLPMKDMFTILLVTSVLFISHIIIDKRDIVKFIMHMKGIQYDDMNTKYGWLQVSIDQRLHELVILVLAVML